MTSANERIERKYHQSLAQYDPRHAAKLDDTFMNHLAAAIRASSSNERQQALDKAIAAYDNAVDDVLYDI
jgi:hypothetical protein